MDIERARACFPALGNNNDFVFADNAGGSQVLEGVVKKLATYMIDSNVQMADYSYASKAEKAVASGLAAAALFAGTKSENIMFGSSATQLFETLSRLIERKVYEENDSKPWAANEDEIIITSADHEANRGAWRRMALRNKLKLKTWNPTRIPNSKSTTSVYLSIDELEKLVTPNTKIVAFTASSNVLGSHFTDEEFQKISAIVKEKSDGKAFVAVDAVAFAPHMRLRPESWGVDFVVWSWYKVFGPHVGCMYVSPRSRLPGGIIAKLNHHFLHGLEGQMYPYQPSSVQYELVVSVTAVVDYLLWLGDFHGKVNAAVANDYTSIDFAKASSSLDQAYRLISNQEQTLANVALDRLNSIPGLSVLGNNTASSALATRAPTIAFSIDGLPSKQVHTNMVKYNEMGAQVGHMYAYALMETVTPPLINVSDGVARISFVHYNTVEEVEKVCKIVERAADREGDQAK